MKVSGTFDVVLKSIDFSVQGIAGNHLGRMTIEKQYYGDLEAISKGEMLSVITTVEGSAGYVAVEQVSGTLAGQSGSFVLQHFAIKNRGTDRQVLEVVPDSATGAFSGLAGSMTIRIENGTHYYEFEYQQPD